MFIKSIVGYFVGESSKKRQMGLIAAFLFSFLYWQDVITLELFEAIMPFVVVWTGAAFSARLTKLQKAVVKAKK
ncbi:hypothetical protein LCGC14_2830560 [marine sediment metagenome]|uniref:Uncharacterized protein n=1 Tax=marine sediment metagenome TaxID=412755 RepID=A0A0F8YE71_9ZZZZ